MTYETQLPQEFLTVLFKVSVFLLDRLLPSPKFDLFISLASFIMHHSVMYLTFFVNLLVVGCPVPGLHFRKLPKLPLRRQALASLHHCYHCSREQDGQASWAHWLTLGCPALRGVEVTLLGVVQR